MPSSAKPVRFAVVGAGMIGELHAKLIAELPETELACVFSRDMGRAKGLTDKYGGRPVTDFGALLADGGIDAVSVCTASGEHAQFGVPASKAGKHVLVEKPVEINLQRADQLIAACRAAGVKLGVVFQLRFLDASQEVRRAVRAGALGQPVMSDCYMKFYRPQEYYDNSRWKGTLAMDGGGALINQAIHGLDLMLSMTSDIVAVKAYAGVRAHAGIEVEDTCVAVARFADGSFGVIQATTSVQPDFQQRIELHGTKGTILLEGTEDTWVKLWETEDEKRECAPPEPVEHTGAAAVLEVGGEGHRRQIADFAAAIREDREPAVNGEEGRRSLAVVQAVYESARAGKETAVRAARRG